MKKSLSLIAFLALFAQPAFATQYTVDPAHSSVGFEVRHLVTKVDGGFRDFEGKLTFDKAKPASFSLTASAQVASINTNNDKRDGHLKSPDFFDAAKYPVITFQSTKLEKVSDSKFKATGNFTMHGVTKPVTFDVDYMGEAKDPQGNTHAGAQAVTTVNRKDFGIVWNKTLDTGALMLGEDVKITLNLELLAQK